MKSVITVKIILAVLLFSCLSSMPYGYYQLVRYLAFFGFAFLAGDLIKSQNINLAITYIFLAFLFQPFFKIALGRNLWNFIDVVVGTVLLISVINPLKNNKYGR